MVRPTHPSTWSRSYAAAGDLEYMQRPATNDWRNLNERQWSTSQQDAMQAALAMGHGRRNNTNENEYELMSAVHVSPHGHLHVSVSGRTYTAAELLSERLGQRSRSGAHKIRSALSELLANASAAGALPRRELNRFCKLSLNVELRMEQLDSVVAALDSDADGYADARTFASRFLPDQPMCAPSFVVHVLAKAKPFDCNLL